MMIVIVSLIVFVDQFAKFLASKFLTIDSPVPVIKGFFYLTLVHNRGAAFGILRNQIPLFVFTSVVAIALIYFNLNRRTSKRTSLYSLSLNLILAGALGNLIDRVARGHVVDFFDFRVWPVFNIADSAITIGAVLLGWLIIFKKDASPNL